MFADLQVSRQAMQGPQWIPVLTTALKVTPRRRLLCERRATSICKPCTFRNEADLHQGKAICYPIAQLKDGALPHDWAEK